MKKLQTAIWANFKEDLLDPISGIQPTQMKKSAGTALSLVLDDSTKEKFGADIIRFAPNSGVELHTHSGAHILLVTKGTGVLTYRTFTFGDGIADEKHSLYPGLIYLIPSNVGHAIYAKTELVLIAIGNDHQPVDSHERLNLISKQ